MIYNVIIRSICKGIIMNLNKRQLANCDSCGVLFIQEKEPFCSSCQEKNSTILDILYSYIKEKPTISFDELIKESCIPPNIVVRLFNKGKLTFCRQMKVNCKLCKKEISPYNGKLVCDCCVSKLATNSSSVDKMEKLKEQIREKSFIIKDFKKNNKIDLKPRKYGFKERLKEELKPLKPPCEKEYLPELTYNASLKLSNKFIVTRELVIR